MAMLRVLALTACVLASAQFAHGRLAATPVIVRPSDGEIIARSDVNMTVEVFIANWSPNELVVLLSVNDAPMAPERVAERFNTFSLEPLPEGHHVVTAKLLAVQDTTLMGTSAEPGVLVELHEASAKSGWVEVADAEVHILVWSALEANQQMLADSRLHSQFDCPRVESNRLSLEGPSLFSLKPTRDHFSLRNTPWDVSGHTDDDFCMLLRSVMRAKNRQDRTDRFLRARLGLMLAARGASDAAAHNLIVAVGTSFPVATGALSAGHDTSCWRHSETRLFSATTLSVDGSSDELPTDCGEQIAALVEEVESAIMSVAAKAQLGALFLAAASRADPAASGPRQSTLMAVAERQLRQATRSYDNVMNSTMVRWAILGEADAPVAALDTLRQFVVSSVSHDVPAELARRSYFFVGMLRATAARLPLAYSSHRGRPVPQRELVVPFHPPSVCVATNVSWRVRHHAAGLFHTWRPLQVPGLASHLAVRVPRCPRQHRAPILAVHFLQRFLGWAQVHVNVAIDNHRAQPMLERRFVGAHNGEQVSSIVSALPQSVASAPSVQLTRLQTHALVDMVSSDSNDQASRGADPTCFDAHIQLGNLFDWASHSDRCGTGMWVPARCPTRANDGRPHPRCTDATGRIPCHRWHRAALRSEAVLPAAGVYDHDGTVRMPVVHHDAVVNDTMNPCPTAMTLLDYVAVRHYLAAVQIRPDSRAALGLLDAALRRRSASTTAEAWQVFREASATGLVPSAFQRPAHFFASLEPHGRPWHAVMKRGKLRPSFDFLAALFPPEHSSGLLQRMRSETAQLLERNPVLCSRLSGRHPVCRQVPFGFAGAPSQAEHPLVFTLPLWQLGSRSRDAVVALPIAAAWVAATAVATTFVVGSTQMLLLLPGAHVLPDVADTNLGVRVHVPLSVGAHVAISGLSRRVRGCGNRPQHGYLRVGDRVRRWAQGKPLAFDPSFEHEMVNCGEHPVLLLVVDAWKPVLTQALPSGARVSSIPEMQQWLTPQAFQELLAAEQRGGSDLSPAS